MKSKYFLFMLQVCHRCYAAQNFYICSLCFELILVQKKSIILKKVIWQLT